jgi:hypothetical protein
MLLAMSDAARPPVLTAVITAIALRVVTALATLFILWPLLGIPVALLYGTSFLAAGVAAELLLGAVLAVAGVVAGVRVRRDPAFHHRAAIITGWVLTVDTVVYLVGVAAGAGLVGWRVLPSIVAGNLVLLWLGVRVVRRGRALVPPPEREHAGAP